MMPFHGEKINNRPTINIILDAYSVIVIVTYLLRDRPVKVLESLVGTTKVSKDTSTGINLS